MSKTSFIFILLIIGLSFVGLGLFVHCSGDVSSVVEDGGVAQKPCKNTAQCDRDEVCVNNICVKKDGGSITTCRNTNDCAPDEECINS
ncbi:MAG: hypothetical protein N2746_12260, partial [Deltaproteobacteria bacterium]|nr:hypothetical protein [Deltaproteobacteria bacterium]